MAAVWPKETPESTMQRANLTYSNYAECSIEWAQKLKELVLIY